MGTASRDNNFVTTLLAVSSVDGVTPVTLYANPTTHRLLVDLAGGGSGTVQTVSIASANGFAGTSNADPTNPSLTLSTTVTGILKGNGTAISAVTIGSGLSYDGTTLSATGGGSGTVTTLSIVTANGFAGTVANATTTPAVTLTTSVTGILKGNGTAMSAATAADVISAYYFVAANDATTKEKALADYQCDGTADEVQINAALDAIRAVGGEVRLSSGNFAIAAAINMDGNGAEADDNPFIKLIGSGSESTILTGGSNINVIETGQRAKYEMAYFTAVASGSGDCISQTAGTERGNWQSWIHDVYLQGNFTNHTGWGIDMQSPFRMRFTNVEMNGVANGINLQAHTNAFNPGNLTVDRMFIDLWNDASNANAIAFQLAVQNTTAENVMNLVSVNRLDIAGGTNLTNSIGINIVGASASFGDSRHHSFTNLNIEDVKTCIKHVRGRDCTYRDLNYCRPLSGGTVIDLDSTSHNNSFENLYAVAQGSGQTFNLIVDANSSNNLPNKLSRVDGYQPSSTTINATLATSTILEYIDLSGGSPTIDSDITNRSNLFTVGSGTGTGIIQSRGNNDITIRTGNSTTGSITIADGANGDISVTPNGSGSTVFTGNINTVTDRNTFSQGVQVNGSFIAMAANSAINWNSGNATLTHSTGLLTSNVPLSLGTSNALTAGTIELGAASDTTISRSAAGVIAVEGVVIPSISSTNTLTNKRITKRTGTTTSSATPSINTDNVDYYSITAQTADITSMSTNLTGTPTTGQQLRIDITGTAARAITWGASFSNGPVALPTTTVTTTRLYTLFEYDGTVWRCMASGSTV